MTNSDQPCFSGAGVLALPYATLQAGIYGGTIMLIFCGVLAAYTGIVLSRCFKMVSRMPHLAPLNTNLERQSKHEGNVPLLTTDYEDVNDLNANLSDEYKQFPYVHIGKVSMGYFGEYLVMFSQLFALMGVGIAFILLAAGNLSSLWDNPVNPASYQTPQFYMYMIAIFVTPLSWLESPKDFWQAAFIATAATATVCVGGIVLLFQHANYVAAPAVTFDSFFTAYGTILFAYVGHALFPTLQVDMTQPGKFNITMIVAFAFILVLYVPISAIAVQSFGVNVQPNILLNMGGGTAAKILTVIITLHLVFAITIIQNPISRLMDRWLHVPSGFNLWRVLIRTNQIAICLIIALSVPGDDFSCVINLVGAITTSPLAFICPSMFYLSLCYKTDLDLPKWEWALHLIIIAFGLFGGASATRAAVLSCPF